MLIGIGSFDFAVLAQGFLNGGHEVQHLFVAINYL